MLTDKLIANELAALTKDEELEQLRAEVRRLQKQLKQLEQDFDVLWEVAASDNDDWENVTDLIVRKSKPIVRRSKPTTAPAGDAKESEGGRHG